MNTIRVAKLYDNAILPNRKNPTDAGMDLYAWFDDYHRMAIIPPHIFTVIHTGITIEIPKGYVGLIWPKGRNNHLIGGGVVDQDYQGEILVKIANIYDTNLTIAHGDAIAQLIIVPVFTPEIVETPLDEIHKVETFRGGSGGIVEQVATVKSNIEVFTDGTVGIPSNLEPHEGITWPIERWD